MKYRDCVEGMQAEEDWLDDQLLGGMRVTDASINVTTGLATDYLNHFNEAVMLLELMAACPECIEDFRAWRSRTYSEHFALSRFKDRAIAIAAYEAAAPAVRDCLDALASTMNSILSATVTAMRAELPAEASNALATRTIDAMRPLIARAGAVINGDADSETGQVAPPQALVDVLMKR